MSHREKGLTPHIMSDDAKHAECIKRTGWPCVVLPPHLYSAAEAAGHDMSGFVRNKPMPPIPPSTLHEPKGGYGQAWRDVFITGAFHNMEMKPGYVAQGSVTRYRPIRDDVVTDRPKPEPMTNTIPRKNRDSVSCHNCMPGKGGRCVCCEGRD